MNHSTCYCVYHAKGLLMFHHITKDSSWVDGDTNPKDDSRYFIVDATELRELRLKRMVMRDMDD